MNNTRNVDVIKPDKDNPLDAWDVISKECPMLPHLLALGMTPKSCFAGVVTNIQGVVPLAFCKHYVKESFKADGQKKTIQCGWVAP